jgi:hypothetical protein
MKRTIFHAGFGVSAMLVAVCAWYAFLSPVRSGVLQAFEVSNHGWYVSQPPIYNLCLLAFTILNVPAVLLFWMVVTLIDSIVTLSACARAAITFALFVVASAMWWKLIAYWTERKRRALRNRRADRP